MVLSSLALSLLLGVPQQLPAQVPHPSHVLTTNFVRDAAESDSENELVEWGWDTDEPIWVSLKPSWLSGERPPALGTVGMQDLAVSVGGSLNGWDAATSARWLQSVSWQPIPLRYELRLGEKLLLGGMEAVWPGEAKVFTDYKVRSVVSNFDVEIAQQAVIADPENGLQYAGASLAVELLPVPGMGWQAEVALVTTDFGKEERIDTGYYAIQGMDRLRQGVREGGFTTMLGSGTAHRFVLPGPEGNRYELELAVSAELPAAIQELGPEASYVVVPASAVRPNWVERVNLWNRDGDFWTYEGGYLGFPTAAKESLGASILAAAKADAQMLDYSMRVTFATESGVRTLASFDASAVHGVPVSFASGELGHALMDWDVEVACTARIADPHFEVLFSGIKGHLQGELAGDSVGPVALNLEFSRVQHGNPTPLRLSGEVPAHIGHEGAAPPMPADQVLVERPETGRLKIAGTFVPVEGKIEIQRQVRSLFAEAGVLTVELEVRRP